MAQQSSSAPSFDQQTRILKAARRYLAHGWRVVAIYAINPSDGRCTCKQRCNQGGKHAIGGVKEGLHSILCKFERTLERFAGAGVGIVLGQASGIVVVDVDPRHGGHVIEHGNRLRVYCGINLVTELPATRTQRSGGGGWHLVYQWHPDAKAAKLAGNAVELKVGGFIVAAPTVHRSGGVYTWERPARPVAELPADFIEQLRKTAKTPPVPIALPPPVPCDTDAPTNLPAIFARIEAKLLADREGQRQGEQIQFRCVAGSHEDRHPSMWWHPGKNGGVFRCLSCGASGGWWKLARLLKIPVGSKADRNRGKAQEVRLNLSSSYRWRGVRGSNARLLAAWACGELERTGQNRLPVSTRHAADSVGLSRNGGRGALLELQKLHVLRMVTPQQGLRAPEFVLGHASTTYQYYPPPLGTKRGGPVLDSGTRVSEPSHDAFRRCKGAQGLWLALCERPRTVLELGAYHPVGKTVGRWLAVLSAMRLVHQDEQGRWCGRRASQSALDTIAEQRGTKGRARATAERHKTDRRFRLVDLATRYGAVAGVRSDEVAARRLPDGTVVVPATGEILQDAPRQPEPLPVRLMAWLVPDGMAAPAQRPAHGIEFADTPRAMVASFKKRRKTDRSARDGIGLGR